jgi:hypothetical protein
MPNPAKMIDMEAIGDRPDKDFVSEAVCINVPAGITNAKRSIAIRL